MHVQGLHFESQWYDGVAKPLYLLLGEDMLLMLDGDNKVPAPHLLRQAHHPKPCGKRTTLNPEKPAPHLLLGECVLRR